MPVLNPASRNFFMNASAKAIHLRAELGDLSGIANVGDHVRHLLALDVPDDDPLRVHLPHAGDAVVCVLHQTFAKGPEALRGGDIHLRVLEIAARIGLPAGRGIAEERRGDGPAVGPVKFHRMGRGVLVIRLGAQFLRRRAGRAEHQGNPVAGALPRFDQPSGRAEIGVVYHRMVRPVLRSRTGDVQRPGALRPLCAGRSSRSASRSRSLADEG